MKDKILVDINAINVGAPYLVAYDEEKTSLVFLRNAMFVTSFHFKERRIFFRTMSYIIFFFTQPILPTGKMKKLDRQSLLSLKRFYC